MTGPLTPRERRSIAHTAMSQRPANLSATALLLADCDERRRTRGWTARAWERARDIGRARERGTVL